MTDDERPDHDLQLRDAAGPPGLDAGSPQADETPSAGTIRIRWWVVVAVLGTFMAVGIWFVASRLPGFLTQPEDDNRSAATPTAAPAGDSRRIQATLFYISEDGTALTGSTRDVPFGTTPMEQARRIVETQVQTPEGLVSAIPAGTTVRSVFLTEDHFAFVDLGGTIATGHSGGSLDEALAVYAIVNAIAVNMPDVVGVQILIEGKEVDTLSGHVDLRFPLPKALDWIQKGQ
jgi:hypothetical protein